MMSNGKNSFRDPLRRSRKIVGTGIVVGLLGLMMAASAEAAFSSGDYSHGSYPCSSASVDPITHVVYGSRARYSRTRIEIQASTGWSADDNADQWANSFGGGQWQCTQMDGEVYSGPATASRYHERLNQTAELDNLGRFETVGTPHHDLLVWWDCGIVPRHVADDYSGARNIIMGAMNARGYGYSWQWWGNSEPQRQCDGRRTSADGWVGWSNIG